MGGLKALKDKIESNDGTEQVYQIFLGSPQRLMPDNLDAFAGMRVPDNIKVVAHGPFVYSLVCSPTESLWRASLKACVACSQFCNQVGIKYYVVHPGGIKPYQDKKSGYLALLNFVFKYLEMTWGLDTILSLENDPGSSTGRKITDVNLLYKAVKEISDPRVRITYDTEHAYASGFNISDMDKLVKLMDYVSVVHMNSVPKEVKFGSHLDRHSSTRITESKDDLADVLKHISQYAASRNIIQILERDRELVSDDISFLEG